MKKKSIINIQFGIENRVINRNFESLGIANLDTIAYSASEIKLTFFSQKKGLTNWSLLSVLNIFVQTCPFFSRVQLIMGASFTNFCKKSTPF